MCQLNLRAKKKKSLNWFLPSEIATGYEQTHMVNYRGSADAWQVVKHVGT